MIEVPYLDHDVHDLAGLMEINRYLFAAGADGAGELRVGHLSPGRPTAGKARRPTCSSGV